MSWKYPRPYQCHLGWYYYLIRLKMYSFSIKAAQVPPIMPDGFPQFTYLQSVDGNCLGIANVNAPVVMTYTPQSNGIRWMISQMNVQLAFNFYINSSPVFLYYNQGKLGISQTEYYFGVEIVSENPRTIALSVNSEVIATLIMGSTTFPTNIVPPTQAQPSTPLWQKIGQGILFGPLQWL